MTFFYVYVYFYIYFYMLLFIVAIKFTYLIHIFSIGT